ncbi:glycerophosphodiester phosphodiesterase family protein [Halomonas sp. HL-93]|uniref:glycerophosphodiester phosphodiesterase family protein n=1 Tax=Halomonas sp. HL-93 TaxID=1666906 RepID=UPI0006DA1292|nr:glycerophosphodiester phosphodiesterase family protein [Halomonas sp. HL-93]KPQ21620.1 MAG: glycerophosphoryl diester phosphodiesterase GlpQ [Halomonas sp. HL-93]SBR49203.1 glycerophosphoryl diester phosphodiesterase [Halomonas sp. HL-93]
MHPEITLPTLIAHRGYSAAAPENTLSAVRAAHHAGVSWVELDVQLLGDGTPVIWHDVDINRCSDGRGKLRHLSWKQTQDLDVGRWFSAAFAGEKMASLEAMLALVDELDMGINLELKVNRGHDPIALVERVLPVVLEALPAERFVLSSFDQTALRHSRTFATADNLALGVLVNRLPKGWQTQCGEIDAFSLHANWSRLKRAQADAIQQAGYSLLCYTPNNPVAFQPLWAWGAASAITDEPEIFQRYLSAPTATPPALINEVTKEQR